MRLKAVLLASVLASGCGTLQNVSPVAKTETEDGPKQLIYGGVRRGNQQIAAALDDLKQYPESQKSPIKNISTVSFHAVDAPLSLVGDTLTLPVTVRAQIDRAVVEYYFPDHAAESSASKNEAVEATSRIEANQSESSEPN